jgi:hypothetical protein
VLPVCLPPCCPALRSKFGNLFRKAADATAAQVKHDGFDLSVIEIKKEDLRKVYGPSSMHLNPLLFLPITRTVCHTQTPTGRSHNRQPLPRVQYRLSLTGRLVAWFADYLSINES